MTEIPLSPMPSTPTEDSTSSLEGMPEARRRGRFGLKIILGILIFLLLAGSAAGAWYLSLKNQEDAFIQQAEVALKAGDWQAAEQASDSALAIQPQGMREHVDQAIGLRGEARFQLGKFDQALPDIQQTLANSSSRADLHRYLAEIYYQQGKQDDALREADLAIKGGQDFVLPDQIQLEKALQAHDDQAVLNAANEVLKHEDSVLALGVLGRAALMKADFAKATDQLNRALAVDPNDVEALALKVFLDANLDRVDQVKSGSEATIKAAPESAAALWAEAIAAQNEFDHDRSLERINRAIELAPDRAEFYLTRANGLWKSSERTKALEDLAKVLELDPNNPYALYNRAFLLFQHYELDKPQQAAQDLIDRYPGFYGGYYLQTNNYLREWDLKNVTNSINKAIEVQPDLASTYNFQAAIYINFHDFDQATVALEKVYKLNPRSVHYFILQSMMSQRKKEYAKALEWINQGLEITKESPDVFEQKSEVFYAMKEYAQARVEIKHALDLDPSDYGSLAMQASIEGATGNNYQAIAVANRMVEAFPKDPNGYAVRAASYFSGQDPEYARQDAVKATLIDSRNTAAHYVLASLEMADENYSGAVYELNKIIDLMPWDADAILMRGAANVGRLETEQGISDLEKALKLDPELLEAHFWLGVAHQFQEYYPSAVQDYQRFLKDTTKIENLNMIDQAETNLAFVKTIPPAINGERTYSSTEDKFSITYPTTWRQMPVAAESRNQGQVMALIPTSISGQALFYVIVYNVPAEGNRQTTIKEIADSVDAVSKNADSSYKLDGRVSFTTNQRISGLATIFQSSNLYSNIATRVKCKYYYLVQGERVVVLAFIASVGDFEDISAEADQITATFSFNK